MRIRMPNLSIPVRLACVMAAAAVGSSCERKSKSPGAATTPRGDANVVVCMGDSVTHGGAIDGPPYPQLIAEHTGKRVINAGVGGSKSGDGVPLVGKLLSQHKPGYLTILYGINDIINYSRSYDGTIHNLRKMIREAQEGGAIAIIGTIPPRFRPETGLFDDRHMELNRRIRKLAEDEDARLADVEKAFGNRQSLLLPDGFHPNDDGNRIIAVVFREAL